MLFLFQSGACDIISFGSTSFSGNTNTLTFVSDGTGGADSRADTDISSFAGAAGRFQELIETGPEANNMASVTDSGGSINAGAPANGGSVTYTFISDGTATSPVPDPTSLLLLGSGLAGLAGWRRWRRAAYAGTRASLTTGGSGDRALVEPAT